jgi:hypothetical protein
MIAHVCDAAMELGIVAVHLELEGAGLGWEQLKLTVAALVHGRAVAGAVAWEGRLAVDARAEHFGLVAVAC